MSDSGYLTNQLLIAMPYMGDPNFARTVVLVCDHNSQSALGLILFLAIVAMLAGAPHYDLAWLMVAILLLIAVVPVVLAVAVTLWAATRPSEGHSV